MTPGIVSDCPSTETGLPDWRHSRSDVHSELANVACASERMSILGSINGSAQQLT